MHLMHLMHMIRQLARLSREFFFANLFRTGQNIICHCRQLGTLPTFTCVFSGCDFNSGNEAQLDQHYAIHYYANAGASPNPLMPLPAQFPGLVQSEHITAHWSDDNHDMVATGSTNIPSVTAESTPLEFRQWTPTTGPKESRPRHTPSNRPFKCSDCPSSFHRKGDCRRHMRTRDEAPGIKFDCLVTGCSRKGLKGFARRDNLKEHVAARHHSSDFDHYLNSYWYSNYRSSSFRRFSLWQREKCFWQTEHPLAEIPPLLSETFCTYYFKCPYCACDNLIWYRFEPHMQAQNPVLHIPFWLQDNIVYGLAELDEKEMLEKLRSLSVHEQTSPRSKIPTWVYCRRTASLAANNIPWINHGRMFSHNLSLTGSKKPPSFVDSFRQQE